MYHLPPSLRHDFGECEVFDSLAAFSNEVDRRMSESIQMWSGYFFKKKEGGAGIVPRTLRMCIYNTHDNQIGQFAVAESGGHNKAPTWTLRIEGRLLPDPSSEVGQESTVKFSHFIKRISVELDNNVYKSDYFIEWDNRRHVGETDGFEITREGDREMKVKIMVEVAYPIQVYKLSLKLSKFLNGTKLETHDQIVRSVWMYCKFRKLVVEYERESFKVVCDPALSELFECESFTVDELPKLLRPHLHAAPMIELDYVVKLSGKPEDSMKCFDIQVQDPHVFMATSLKPSKEVLDIDKELAQIVEQINAAHLKQKAFQALAANPSDFIHDLIRSSQRDSEFLEAEESKEGLRYSSYYNHPYVADAARQYLLRQKLSNNKKNDPTEKK